MPGVYQIIACVRAAKVVRLFAARPDRDELISLRMRRRRRVRDVNEQVHYFRVYPSLSAGIPVCGGAA